MAEGKTVNVIPLNGSNYGTWKLQCRMALVRDGLWGIVNGTETAPTDGGERRSKFLARRDRALATIVLAVDPALLYLLGDPDDPVTVWKKLQDQFQKKSWSNKLALRRRLHSLHLKDGDSIQDHVKAMTELFNDLTVVGDTIEEEDRVVYLLASLPESFSTLVTALEASQDIPKMESVTERLLHHKRKQKEKATVDVSGEKVMITKKQFKGRGPRCHYCHKFGHIQRFCPERSKTTDKRSGKGREKVDKTLVTCHVLSVGGSSNQWIIDSGATCHICYSKELFEDLHVLGEPQHVTLGDGRQLKVVGKGDISLKLKLPGGCTDVRKVIGVLYVPELTYNLLSVPRLTESGKEVSFNE